MEVSIGMTENEVEKLASVHTSHAINAYMENSPDFEDSEALTSIVLESMRLLGTILVKRHCEEILKVQELYFDHTRKVNETTIDILKNLVIGRIKPSEKI